jgi:hypothetical protein
MTSSPERTPKKTLTVALAAVACLSVAIATVVNTCYIAYSMHVTIFTLTLYFSAIFPYIGQCLQVITSISLALALRTEENPVA